MLDRKNLVQLMKTVAKADPSTPTAYSFNGESLSYDALNETLRRELNELAGTYSLYRENKNLKFFLRKLKSNTISLLKLRPLDRATSLFSVESSATILVQSNSSLVSA